MDALLTAAASAQDIDARVCTLLDHALPGHPDARFFATVIGKSLALRDLARTGLSPAELAGLLASLFPGARAGTARAGALRRPLAWGQYQLALTSTLELYLPSDSLMVGSRSRCAVYAWVTVVLLFSSVAILFTDREKGTPSWST